MNFDLNSRLFRGFTEVIQFILLNFLFLIACMPIITVAHAVSAIYHVTLNQVEHQEGYIVKDFLKALTSEWKKKIIISLVFEAITIFLIFQINFWLQFHTLIGFILCVVFLILELLCFATFILACCLMERFVNTTRQTIKNAFFMVLSSPIHTSMLLAIPLTMVALVYISTFFKLFAIVVGWSFVAYCNSYCILSLIKKFQ
ncbi:DUF624 domain-containing protein [Streptococcus suis]|uniref:DUF624 domain-containing protein n=1 Tax=Streptococcus suis TaxID=1307 RepID=UPI0022A783AF|nr:DUF624 domain-containing protein [Streptococcus suis]MBL1125062.1 DUF624 domain-containing protein [Streptococcus suis]